MTVAVVTRQCEQRDCDQTFATSNRSRRLRIAETRREQPCALCGCVLDPYAWSVALPERLGRACPGCASDAGWTVR